MNLNKNNRFLFVLSLYFENIFASFSLFLRWQEINTDLVREEAGVNITSKEI